MGITWKDATAAHVNAFRRALLDAGLKHSTVALRIAALSSLFEYGIAAGVVALNPCRNLRQRRMHRYHTARPLTEAQAQALLAACDIATLSGARDYAFILTFLLTGWRSAEVLGLRWGDLEQSNGAILATWTGKGDKHTIESFPCVAFDSISSYLQLAGRWQPDATAYIWQPLDDRGCANLTNVTAPLASDRHISAAQANRILRKLLLRTGMTAAQAALYSIHDLRHTFAHICADNGIDPYRLQGLLHHEKLTTTLIYIAQMQRAVDDSAARLVAGRLGVGGVSAATASRQPRLITKANA
jgi:integrase/recombinase XerD